MNEPLTTIIAGLGMGAVVVGTVVALGEAGKLVKEEVIIMRGRKK